MATRETTLTVEGIVPFFPSIMAIPPFDGGEFNSSHCICSDLQHEDYSPLYAWFNYIVIIVMLPSLSVFGVITNFVNIFVFTRPCMKNSSNTYLLFLAFSDFSVVLTGLFIFWIDSARSYIPQLVQAPYTTVYTLPFGYMAQSCSIYFTVAAAFDCYICLLAQTIPFHCTIKKAKNIIYLIIICSIIYNSLRFPQFNLRKCIHDGSGDMIIEICPTYLFYHINTIYNVYLYMFAMTLFPFFILLLLNTLIIIRKSVDAKHSRQLKKSISLSSSSSPTIQQQNNSINSPIIYHKNGNLKFSPLKSAPSIESTGTINPSSDETITMVMVVVLFLCCNTLSLIVNLIETFFEPDPLLLNLLSDASNFLVVFNSSVNCVIYLIFNKEYSQVFIKYFTKCFKCFGYYIDKNNNGIKNGNINLLNQNNSKFVNDGKHLITTHSTNLSEAVSPVWLQCPCISQFKSQHNFCHSCPYRKNKNLKKLNSIKWKAGNLYVEIENETKNILEDKEEERNEFICNGGIKKEKHPISRSPLPCLVTAQSLNNGKCKTLKIVEKDEDNLLNTPSHFTIIQSLNKKPETESTFYRKNNRRRNEFVKLLAEIDGRDCSSILPVTEL
uniref:G-protein coupled receptors family 1 profile domain-containing protein n=1 Tax=Meloidogyne enterolobii TaxID=390850 RepID=A0A6V7U695_MELEN|nr:unnamed protein product [Meloidogyne enterolobii]